MTGFLLRAAIICIRRFWFLSAGICCDGNGIMPYGMEIGDNCSYGDAGITEKDEDGIGADFSCPSREIEAAEWQAVFIAASLLRNGRREAVLRCIDESGEPCAVFHPQTDQIEAMREVLLPELERICGLPCPPSLQDRSAHCAGCPAEAICRA